MKRCPECRRDYYDDSLLYCLDDGAALLEGPAWADEPETARFRSFDGPSTGGKDAEETRSFKEEKRGTTSSAEYLIGEIKIHRRGVIGIGLILVVGTGVGFLLFKYSSLFQPTTQGFQKFSITRISTTGRDHEATISPDGKFIAYLRLEDDGNRGLDVKQTATGNIITIVPATKGNILKGTTFSPDGNFVYYLFTDRTRSTSLYQVSSVGGTPKKIIDVCHSAVAFSPDGRKIAFLRYENNSKSVLITANVDGTEELTAASLEGDQFFSDAGPSWAPDGKTIGVAAGGLIDGIESMRLVGVDTATGAIRELSSNRWVDAGRVAWIPDGTALVLIGIEGTIESAAQVWRVSYPSGEASRLTNDVYGYDDTSLSVSGDSGTILAVTSQRFSRIENIPAGGDSTRPLRISSSDANQDGLYGFAFANAGRIVFSSFEGGKYDLWLMNSDGGGRQRVTSDSHFDIDPVVSPDGRTIIFRSNRPDGAAVLRLWKINLDGTNAVQLAARADSPPDVSPDGRSVIFSVWAENRQSLSRIPIDGGSLVPVTTYSAWSPNSSPNGQWIGCYYSYEQDGKRGYGIVPAVGGDPVRSFDFPGFQYAWVRWTPDGRSLSHIGAPPDPSNIWLQPSQGGDPKKLTDFKSDYIFRHAWSPDGKTLAVARGRPAFDVVLLKDDR